MKTVPTKNMKPMHNELFSELEKAMASNPDLSMFDAIKYVTDKAFPSRITYIKFLDNYEPYIEMEENWKLTNSDILKALKQFNSRV